MRVTFSSLAATLAAAPALAHEEAVFASPAVHEIAHAHAVGGWFGLLALVAAGAAAAVAVSPRLRDAAARTLAGLGRPH